MNSRLESLISRGYPRDVVMSLASFTDEELEYASECAFEHLSKNCTPVDNPNAIFIGGQPGCGKTIMSMNLKKEIKNAVEIGIDNYRMYHPRYLEIEKVIRNFWKDKKESTNASPGNDIANFTHYFAGAMTDKLIEMGSSKGYSLLLEWGMREPSGPLKSMENFKAKGYNNVVLFVTTHKDISYAACNLRADIMKRGPRLIRKVPKSFHDVCIDTLPDSINTIYKKGYSKGLIDYMALVTRDNEVIWDDKDKRLPGDIYKTYLNNRNYEYDENSSFIAYKANRREMHGLKKDIFGSKESIVCLDLQAFDINSKIK